MIRSGVLSFAVVGSFMIAGCGGSGPTTTGGEEVATTEAALSTNARSTLFFVPPPDPGAVKQIAGLLKRGDLLNALRLTAMIATPQAVWFTGGTPAEVEKNVKKTMAEAALQRRVPVLVAYNLPYRDCA